MTAPTSSTPEPPSQRRARFVLAAMFVILGLWILHDFLAALAWAVVLSIALWPLYQRLLRFFPERSGRVVAPLLLTAIVGIVFVTPLVLLGIAIAHESHILIQLIIAARHNGLAVPQWVNELPIVGPSIADWWRANLSDPIMAEALFGRFARECSPNRHANTAEKSLRQLVIFLFTLLTMFFLFRNGERLATQLNASSVIGLLGEPGRTSRAT